MFSPRMMSQFAVFAAIVTVVTAITPLSTNVKTTDLLRHRHRRSAENGPSHLECVGMTAQEGDFWHVSSGSDAVCGLYVIGDVDKFVELEISDFDISCDKGGLMAIVDGWELEGQLFPSPEEKEGGVESQYRSYCGPDTPPPTILTSSQNVALVQFRVPTPGQGFRVKVRFLSNPEPCNVLAPFDTTAITMKNFGSRRNCTTQIVFPVDIILINADIKATSHIARMRREIDGLSVDCEGPAGGDYASLKYGLGIDTADFGTRMAFCGRREKAARRAVTLGCTNSAIRLVSSGLYHNSLTVELAVPDQTHMTSFLASHPVCLADMAF